MNGLVLPAGMVLMSGAAALSLAVVLGVLTDRRAVARSLSSIGTGAMAASMSPRTSESMGRRVVGPALVRLAALGRRLTPQGATTRLAQQLDLAGNPSRWSIDRVLAVKAAGALGGPALGMLLFSGGGMPRAVLVSAGMGAAGFFLPNVLVYNAGTKRQEQIQKTLPDALDLLTVSVEAGMGFDAAIGHVGKNTKGPLSGEFFRVLQEMQMKSRSDAFRALGERTTVADLRIFVSALVQADALGIPIGRVLREQTKEMRLKRRQRAEEKAMKVPVKVLFPMVVCILPVLFVIVLAPAGMEIAATLNKGG